MYGSDITPITGGTALSTAGVVALPYAQGNPVASILAYAAIIIGVVAIISQVIVRIVRRRYSN